MSRLFPHSQNLLLTHPCLWYYCPISLIPFRLLVAAAAILSFLQLFSWSTCDSASTLCITLKPSSPKSLLLHCQIQGALLCPYIPRTPCLLDTIDHSFSAWIFQWLTTLSSLTVVLFLYLQLTNQLLNSLSARDSSRIRLGLLFCWYHQIQQVSKSSLCWWHPVLPLHCRTVPCHSVPHLRLLVYWQHFSLTYEAGLRWL